MSIKIYIHISSPSASRGIHACDKQLHMIRQPLGIGILASLHLEHLIQSIVHMCGKEMGCFNCKKAFHIHPLEYSERHNSEPN